MDKDFLEWWELRKHEMFYDDNMGVREIAAAAYKAGRESAQPTLAPDGATGAATLSGLYNCYVCGEEKCAEEQKLYLCKDCGTGIVEEVAGLIQDRPAGKA